MDTDRTDLRRRPNLFVVGAMKSGTTSLHSYLDLHPEVSMSTEKEPAFFVPEADWHPKDLDWYLDLFAGAGNVPWVGESSTMYTKRPTHMGVPERILEFSPDARFIYVMRDPITRAISHYWQATKELVETRTLLKAFKEDAIFRQYGDYRYQLEPWFSLVGRDRFFLMTYEALVRDIPGSVNSVFAWLGLPPLERQAGFGKENVRPEVMTRGKGALHRFRSSALWDRLSPWVPETLKSAGRNVALETVRPETVPTEDAIAFLRPWAQERVADLSTFLGRDFPEWTTTHGSGGSGG